MIVALSGVLSLLATLVVIEGKNSCLDPSGSNFKCTGEIFIGFFGTPTVTVNLDYCGLSDDDFDDLEACMSVAGQQSPPIEVLRLFGNYLTTLPEGVFQPLTALTSLYLDNNALTTLPEGVFQPLTALTFLYLDNNALTALPEGVFQPLTALKYLSLYGNDLTALPEGVFQPLTTLTYLYLGVSALAALPEGVFQPLTALTHLNLYGNDLTTLPEGVFQPLTALTVLYLDNNDLTTLPEGVFQPLTALTVLFLDNNDLTTLPEGVFQPLTALTHLSLTNNDLTTLPEGVFQPLTALTELGMSGNDNLECLPSTSVSTTVYGYSRSSSDICECPAEGEEGFCGEGCIDGADGFICPAACDPEEADACPSGQICCPVKKICEEPKDGTDPAACGDPHMTGFLGQKFDFTGVDGGYYALVGDLPDLHLNMRVTSPMPSLPEITYITGLSVLTADAEGNWHSIVIEVREPHTIESSCPAGVSPCLADGSLRVLVDGEEALRAPGTVALSDSVEVSAVNLPGECRSFGFEKYWELKKLENARAGRRLSEQLPSMGEWILGDPTATNMEECTEYVAAADMTLGGLFAHQSEHASFQIATPKAIIRLTHGRLHQLAMRDPTDQFDLPEHTAWQMNLALDHHEVSRTATGILGETAVPTRDADGNPIMTGMAAIRGSEEDYRVGGPLEFSFWAGKPQLGSKSSEA